MKKQKELKLNPFQLNVLLEEEKQDLQFLLDNGVYCNHCKAVCPKGVVDYTASLDYLNDIRIEGHCAACGHKVVRIMELGEDKYFFEKAMEYRQSIHN
ncbi:hypothetical protein [Draconibacterium orientale]|uniref:hypothetical protein n=1 Tax=Draconibacterium orientale TaxID=1168034 RepID=UPI002A0A9675|nr:hypothetical protein [Draconibacterium orientale]